MTTTAYKLGATTSTLVDAITVFHTDVAARNVVTPKSTLVAGGNEYISMDGFQRWRGFKRSRWHFALLAISSYEKGIGILCSLPGTGTVSRNSGDHTQLDGSGTAFSTELAVDDTLLFHLGSGAYETAIVTAITDNDTLTVSASISAALSGATFRYRPQSVYSGACYVSTLAVTHDGVNVYETFSAVAVCPDPSKLNRIGGRYENVDIEFMLKALA